MTKQSQRHVEAVLAALEILDCFQDDAELSLKQLFERTGFLRNRVLRLTGTLQAKGYLVRDPNTALFSLGPKFLVLGKACERRLDLVALARPILRQLTQDTGESATLYIRENLERVVLAREEGTYSIRHTVLEGQRMPLHVGAAGKVLLAFGAVEILDGILVQKTLPKLTANTIIDPGKLQKQLTHIRAQGFATSYGERDPDAASVAAPVFDANNRLVMALSIAGPVSRLTNQAVKKHCALVLQAAHRISELLGASS